ncbi:MAG: hypothetical protein GX958_12855 [Desulfitobacterium sp.]|nr:hypothetical protein [Desulfitobacterium sp.]
MNNKYDFKTLHEEINKLGKHNIYDQRKFSSLKVQILNHLQNNYGETSREYRVVRLTKSPATVMKVMNHIAARTTSKLAVSI